MRVANGRGAAGMAAPSRPVREGSPEQIEDDMKILDEAVGPRAAPRHELRRAASMVSTAYRPPPPETAVEVVVPSAAAVCTAVAMRSEFTGRCP